MAGMGARWMLLTTVALLLARSCYCNAITARIPYIVAAAAAVTPLRSARRALERKLCHVVHLLGASAAASPLP